VTPAPRHRAPAVRRLALLAGLVAALAAGAPAAAAETTPRETTPRARQLFDEAVQAREQMEKSKGIDWAQLESRWRAAADAGGPAEAHYNLGVALERQGKLGEARAAYQRALAEKPLRQAKVNLAVLLEREGDRRGASEAYAAVVRDHPEDGVARARLGALYRESGQLDEAWRLSREALLREPGNPTAYRTMIRVALQRGDADLARLVALRAQKVAPDDAEVAYLAGLVADQQGDAAAGAAQWKRALELQPGFPPARAALLEAAVKRERWSEAAEQATALLAEAPDDAAARLVLGVAQHHQGLADEALRSYAEAERRAGGRLPEVHAARGILLMRAKGDCPGAIEAFDAYQRALGPVLPQGSPVPRLMRECQEQLEQVRLASEAARKQAADAERKAADKAAAPPSPPVPAPAVGKAKPGAAPTPAPSGARGVTPRP